MAAAWAGTADRAHAQTSTAGDADRQSQIIQHQQQDLLRQEQERALRNDNRQQGADLDALKPQVKVPDIGVPCREIRRIEFGGDVARLTDDVRHRVAREYEGHCLGSAEIEAILALVTKSYIDRGFVTTRAYLPAQDLRTGVLRITVVEGRIERYDIESGRGNAVRAGSVFPAAPGELLNLRDLEQGVDQINRLSSNNATLDLRPGTQPGQTVVLVKNPAATPVHLYASLDNTGVDATGRDAASATLSFDSLLGLDELIAITHRQTVFPATGDHRSNATALFASVPWGYTTFTLNASQSNYANALDLASGKSLDATGRTDLYSFGVERIVYRGRVSRVSLSASLTTQDNDNWFGGQHLEVSSRKLTYLDLGPTFYTVWLGGMLDAHLGVTRGLGILGALHDSPALTDDLPHAQFTKLAMDLGYNRRFEPAGRPLLLSSQLSVQRGVDTLYGTQQMLIGGPASVRGFLDTTLSGDSGFYLRNDLSLPWQVAAGKGGSVSARGYVGFDVGHVNNHAADVASGTLSGATLGLAGQWRALGADLSVSHATHVPDGVKREGTIFFFHLSCSI